MYLLNHTKLRQQPVYTVGGGGGGVVITDVLVRHKDLFMLKLKPTVFNLMLTTPTPQKKEICIIHACSRNPDTQIYFGPKFTHPAPQNAQKWNQIILLCLPHPHTIWTGWLLNPVYTRQPHFSRASPSSCVQVLHCPVFWEHMCFTRSLLSNQKTDWWSP